jgi:hypothetical protein
MAKSDGILSKAQIQNLISDFEQIKADAGQGQYDLVKELYELRTTQVAHRLIPWEDPTDQLSGHDVVGFADAIFGFVVRLEAVLAEATGITLNDLRANADAFEASADQFWRALTSI